ncbi:Het-C-domain-containing protein [Dendrothele bispora CBS 962.96]|uniref:Het-C-domain-containing protein n=1 Tax=Dendrothele bispora (strain CBS 962.96) TaxID=1314807 RepID=A0A4V4HC80_DENBC|nr:Het-C-domain-containing protein [Dendrothele bispora CBS 962.96]
MPSNITLLLLLLFIFAVCLSNNGVYAFGAGNIPSFAYMEGRAFRHGDIEDVLTELAKKAGGGFALASVIGKGGSKFGGLDVKRVYFGNWLRDYSQAVDIAGLKKLPLQTIINLCMVLGFLANGYATNEFEVTKERLGVYLPTEHIDNPKGYGDGEDARQYDPRLRGPVDPVELEIDPRTGMKNYIANENGHWDTSKALVRRTLERCIQIGRMHRSQGRKQDEYEAYRLLGQALHTLEDFSAHSNFCELALISMGHTHVFSHVGDQVRIQARNGQWVAPLITGTFGSSDFIHSLLGEATDHLSEASVTDLNKQLDKARSSEQARSGPGGSGPSSALRTLFSAIPGGAGNDMTRDMDNIDRIRAGPAQGGKRPEDMSPQELHAVLWQVLSFRDSVVKKIEKTIGEFFSTLKIPGLGPLIEKLMDSISVFVFTTLEPFIKPLLQSATGGLQSVSGEVINNHDQYEVFNDPRASDPTHSFLSKDHFNLILNEPAGRVARVVVTHAVNLVVKAWDDSSVNVHQVTEDILSCLFHPDFHDSNSKIQREMMQAMHAWAQSLGGKQHETIGRLSKENVRNHKNIRLSGDGGAPEAQGTYAYNQGQQTSQNLQNYLSGIPGVSQAQSLFGGAGHGIGREAPGSGGGGPGFPGVSHGPGHGQSYGSSAPIPSTGEASSFYGSNPTSGAPSFPGGPSSYAPPASTFPEAPPHDGYNPSYSSSPAPSFPSAQQGGGGEWGGYPPPPGGPPGPGGFAPPGGGPPGFPSASPFGTPGGGGPPGFPDAQTHQPHQHGHHGHHEHHHHHDQQSSYGYGGGGYSSGW